MLAGTLKGVVSQRLVPAADGGRIAACEVLRMTGRVRDVIRDPTQNVGLGRGDRRRQLLRHADVRPGAARPRPLRPGDGSMTRSRLPPARTTSNC